MSRQDLSLVTLTVNGLPYGVWDKMDGGDVDSTELKYRGGGSSVETAFGGAQMVTNVTLTRRYDPDRDATVAAQLRALAGKARAVVSKQPLDANMTPKGTPTVRGGVLKKVTEPAYDAASGAVATFEVEISADGTVA